MNRFSCLIWRPKFHILLLASTLFLFVRYLPLSYIDHDTLIYTLVGQDIYKDGILPYGLFFDHKPFLIYFIYGPLAFINSSLNIFAIFTVLWIFILSSIAQLMLLKRSVPFLLTLFIMSAATFGNVSYSGNSEIVYVSLELLSVGLALGSARRPVWFLLSAAAAVAATNVNYSSGVPLLPTLLFCLYVSSRNTNHFLIRAPMYLVVSISFFGAALGLMALAGADLSVYFLMQRQFLSGYANNPLEPGIRIILLVCVPFLALGLALLLPGLSIKKEFRKLSAAMLLLAVFSLVSFFLSRKFFPHYAFGVIAPITVIFLTLEYSRPWLRSALTLALIGVALVQVATAINGASILWNRTNLYDTYAPLADVVKDQPLMSMHASIVPLYFSKLQPFQPLVWSDHAEIMYGIDADNYYMGLLDQKPPFVMTDKDWCKVDGASWSACAALEARYEQVQSQQDNPPIIGYSLYKLR
jgi:hypothetical protein